MDLGLAGHFVSIGEVRRWMPLSSFSRSRLVKKGRLEADTWKLSWYQQGNCAMSSTCGRVSSSDATMKEKQKKQKKKQVIRVRAMGVYGYLAPCLEWRVLKPRF